MKLEKKIKDTVSIVNHKNNRFVLKKNGNLRVENSWYVKLINITKLGVLHFSNEIAFHKHLETKVFESLNIPSIFETDGKTYFLMEYVDGINGIIINTKMSELLINALYEFQFSTPINTIKKKGKYFNKLLQPIPYILRGSMTLILLRIGFWEFISITLVALKIGFQNRKVSKNGILSHRDIRIDHNIITSSDNKLYFIDFGSTVIVKKFIMHDIVSLAFDIKNMSLDGELINMYVSLLSDNLFFDRNPSFRILDQIRLAMITIVIGHLNESEYLNICRYYLTNILLNKKNFVEFCNENKLKLIINK